MSRSAKKGPFVDEKVYRKVQKLNENRAKQPIRTWSRAWIYPDQADGWAMVSWSKLGSWYLLMMISVVLVTLVHPPRTHEPSASP